MHGTTRTALCIASASGMRTTSSLFSTVLPAMTPVHRTCCHAGFSQTPTLPARIAVWLVPCTAQLLGLHPNTFHCCGGVAGAVRESIVTVPRWALDRNQSLYLWVSRGHHVLMLRNTLGTGRSVFSSGKRESIQAILDSSPQVRLSMCQVWCEQCLATVEVFSFELLCESMN
jgi:hypothetical protein